MKFFLTVYRGKGAVLYAKVYNAPEAIHHDGGHPEVFTVEEEYSGIPGPKVVTNLKEKGKEAARKRGLADIVNLPL